jgi:hypothetical protein
MLSTNDIYPKHHSWNVGKCLEGFPKEVSMEEKTLKQAIGVETCNQETIVALIRVLKLCLKFEYKKMTIKEKPKIIINHLKSNSMSPTWEFTRQINWFSYMI